MDLIIDIWIKPYWWSRKSSSYAFILPFLYPIVSSSLANLITTNTKLLYENYQNHSTNNVNNATSSAATPCAKDAVTIKYQNNIHEIVNSWVIDSNVHFSHLLISYLWFVLFQRSFSHPEITLIFGEEVRFLRVCSNVTVCHNHDIISTGTTSDIGTVYQRQGRLHSSL